VLADAKKSFLDELAQQLWETFRVRGFVDSGVATTRILTLIQRLLGPRYDSIHLARAICGGWDFFLTTDFRSLLAHQHPIVSLRRLIVETYGHQKLLWPPGETEILEKVWGINVCSPLQYLERHWMPLPTLLRTLHGSWTDIECVYQEPEASLSDLIVN